MTATKSHIHFGITLPYDVIVSHGPNCRDGKVAAWSLFRTLPQAYRDELAKHGGFYQIYNPEEVVDEPEQQTPYVHPTSAKGAMILQQSLPLVFAFSQPSCALPTELISNKRVLLLDLDLGKHLVDVVRHAQHVTLCDHHASSLNTLKYNKTVLEEEFQDKFTCIVHTEKQYSGATLAWDLAKSHSEINDTELSFDEDRPGLVEIIRVGDTWDWTSTSLDAKAILLTIDLDHHLDSFPAIEALHQSWDEQVVKLEARGRSVLDYQYSLTKQMAKMCSLGYVTCIDKDGAEQVYSLAYAQATILRSEVGAAIRKAAERKFKVPIDLCASWSYIPDKDLVIFSLRNPREGIDLSQLTFKDSSINCGGHAAAAGFSFTGIERLPSIVRKDNVEELQVEIPNTLAVKPSWRSWLTTFIPWVRSHDC